MILKNNRFLLKQQNGETIENPTIEGLKVDFFGSNNLIEIDEGAVFHNCHFKVRQDCIIIIEKTQPRGLKNTVIDMAGSYNSYLKIAKDCSIESCRFVLTNERNSSISIGEDCLLSSNIVFRANDGHAIYDIKTHEILNHPKRIVIGAHVWIGEDVKVLKGTIIAENTVVATGSVVSKKFEEAFIAIGGNPAKVIKNNINWDRKHIKELETTVELKKNSRFTQKGVQ